MNADGSEQRRLTRNAAQDWAPAWSPDGRKLAFVRRGDVYIMNADGSGQRRLARGVKPIGDTAPAWSPDGRNLAFVSNGHGNLEVYIMNADGSGQRDLTHSPAHEVSFAWSPALED